MCVPNKNFKINEKKKKKPDRTEKRDKPAITLSKIDKTLVVTHKTKHSIKQSH